MERARQPSLYAAFASRYSVAMPEASNRRVVRRECNEMENRLHDLLWAYFSAFDDSGLEPERYLTLQYASMREELIALVNKLSLHGVERPGLPDCKDLPTSYQDLQDRALLLGGVKEPRWFPHHAWGWINSRKVLELGRTASRFQNHPPRDLYQTGHSGRNLPHRHSYRRQLAKQLKVAPWLCS